MIRILIVDDQKLFRRVIQEWLEKESDLEIVGTASNGKMAIEMVESLQPHIVLMDIEMPEMDGLSAIEVIERDFPYVKVIVLTANDDYSSLAYALQSGAKGYLLKGAESSEIINTIRSVHRGYSQLEPRLIKKIIELVEKDKELREYVGEARIILEDTIQAKKTIKKDLEQLQTKVEQRLTNLQKAISELEQQAKMTLEDIPHTRETFEQFTVEFLTLRKYVIAAVSTSIVAIIIGVVALFSR